MEDTAPVSWTLARRLLFRFVFCYLVLYSAPEGGRVSLLEVIPGGSLLSTAYTNLWHAINPWVAIHVFHLSGKVTTYFPTGSGDTTLDYIENLMYLVLAAFITVVWSLLDRRRPNYRTLHAWLRVLVRYTLAFTMFEYGFAKVFPLQFHYPPYFARLTQPYGDLSPMGVLWTFMGSSAAYIIFSGAAEVTGGLLLLFRRTTTLGGMACAAVLANVVALNFCYDVPVKLYSSNLVLMAVFLLVPDLRRLFTVLVLNRPSQPADLAAPAFRRRWLRIGAGAFQVLFVGYQLFDQIHGGVESLPGILHKPATPAAIRAL